MFCDFRDRDVDLLDNFFDDRGLAFHETGPHPFVFGTRRTELAGLYRLLGVGANRLSTTCSCVRAQGARVNTAATVAIFLRLAFGPLVYPTERCGLPGLTMGMPLQSTAATKMEAVCCQGSGRRAA